MTIGHNRSVVNYAPSGLILMAVVGIFLATASPLLAQQTPTANPSGQPAPATAQPTPQASSGELSLREAIVIALRNNLSVRVAGTQVDEAGGTQLRRKSALEPLITSDAVAKIQDTNLRALGFSFPGIRFPLTTGGFGTYDFRFFGQQPVVDRQAYHTYQSSMRQLDAAKLTYQDMRDLVIRQTAGYYLDAQAAAAEVEAAEARVVTSRALEKLARDQHDAGLATGVDVLRSQVQLQRDEQTLLVDRDSYQTALLVLQRFLGVQPGAPIELTDRLEFHSSTPPEVGPALQAALAARADYRSLEVQRAALVEQWKASRARYLPKFSIGGDYGPYGRNFGQMPAVGQIEGTVSFTVFDRDRNGEQREISSQLQRIDAQIDDLHRGIEQELRKALLDLDSTAQQVAVTQAGVELATSELKLSTDRFRNGVTDNIEVITAQSSLQSAQDDHISALARHADARAALARALGATEQNYGNYLRWK